MLHLLLLGLQLLFLHWSAFLALWLSKKSDILVHPFVSSMVSWQNGLNKTVHSLFTYVQLYSTVQQPLQLLVVISHRKTMVPCPHPLTLQEGHGGKCQPYYIIFLVVIVLACQLCAYHHVVHYNCSIHYNISNTFVRQHPGHDPKTLCSGQIIHPCSCDAFSH